MRRGHGHSTPSSLYDQTHDLFICYYLQETGLPRWLLGKEFTCQCRKCGFDPWSRKISWRRKWQPTPAFLPGKPHEQRRPVGYSPWSCKRVRHNLATEQQQHQRQNPRFTFLHDTNQGKWGARGSHTVTPNLLWLHSFRDQPYLHQWVQSILQGTGSSGIAGLCFSSIIAASLQLLLLLGFKSQPWNFLEHWTPDQL